jgi:glutamine amidotransferase
MITIVDYDMANLRSVQKAIEAVGHSARIVRKPDEIRSAEKLIVPGVGAFKDAVRVLRERKLDSAILSHIEKGRPFLGICLGMQMLFERGHEDGLHEGLGLFAGDVVRFTVDKTAGLKVPHMGWNTLNVRVSPPPPLLAGLTGESGAEPSVYFVHSYHCQPKDESIIAATTEYGPGPGFVSSISVRNVHATQFHPEKSQAVGLKILRNFAEL